jgi:hypothetical protein
MGYGTDPVVAEAPEVKTSGGYGMDPVEGSPKQAKQSSFGLKGMGVVPPVGLGYAETGLSMLTGGVGQAVGGLAGLAQGAYNVGAEAMGGTPGMTAADRVSQVEKAITYQPRSEVGKNVAATVSAPFEYLAKKSEDVGGAVLQKTKSPVAATAAETAIQAIPLALSEGFKGVKSARAGGTAQSAADVAAESKARATQDAEIKVNEYAKQHGIDLNINTARLTNALREIAASGTDLSSLPPEAVAISARLEALGIPATRGQLLRNIEQLTKEETASKYSEDIRKIKTDQDIRLGTLIDNLRRETGATAETREQVGKSVQGAARAKVRELKKDYQQARKAAEEAGALQAPVPTDAIETWMSEPGNLRQYPSLRTALDEYLPKDKDGKPIRGSRISINDMVKVLEEANANSRGQPSASTVKAGQAADVIKQVLEQNGPDVWKESRAQYARYKAEFDRQGAVRKLVTEKGLSSDRAVALESTVDHILKSPSEDIAKIKKALTEGGSDAANRRGAQALADIRAGVIDKLREAANKSEITGEAGQLQINSSFNRLFKQLDKDGKIDQIFTKPQAAKLREISQAIEYVRTTPSARIAGSPTAANMAALAVSMLDKIPGGGYISGAVSLVKKVGKVGEEGRVVREAMTSPIEEAARKAKRTTKIEGYKSTLKDVSKQTAPIAPYTLKDMDQNQ